MTSNKCRRCVGSGGIKRVVESTNRVLRSEEGERGGVKMVRNETKGEWEGEWEWEERKRDKDIQKVGEREKDKREISKR